MRLLVSRGLSVCMGRDTTTGVHYERVVGDCIQRDCERFDLVASPQIVVGTKPGGGSHRVDWEISSRPDPSRRGLVSCKVQNTGGTAEEKLVYEVIKLLHAMDQDPRYIRAWLILGGTGWSDSMKSFVVDDLPRWLPQMQGRVVVVPSTDALLGGGVICLPD